MTTPRLREFADKRLAEQVKQYNQLAAAMALSPVFEVVYELNEAMAGATTLVRLPQAAADELYAKFRHIAVGWTRPVLQYTATNVPARVAALTPEPQSWQDLFRDLEPYGKRRFYVDQVLIAVSTLEGCLGIMLDDAHISHSDLTLGQKWGKIRTDAKIAVSPALDLEVSEIVARRNMIIHHNVQYDPGRYDLSRFRSAMCFTSSNETVPKRPGDSFTVNNWYVFHVLDTVGWLVDEVADGERRPVPS